MDKEAVRAIRSTLACLSQVAGLSFVSATPRDLSLRHSLFLILRRCSTADVL
jgi:hypothetical protein